MQLTSKFLWKNLLELEKTADLTIKNKTEIVVLSFHFVVVKVFAETKPNVWQLILIIYK